MPAISDGLADSAASANGETGLPLSCLSRSPNRPCRKSFRLLRRRRADESRGESPTIARQSGRQGRRFPRRAPRRQRSCRLIRRRQRTLLPRPRRERTKCGSCAMCRSLCLVPALPRSATPVRLKFVACRHWRTGVVQAEPSENPHRSIQRGSSTIAVHGDSRTGRCCRAVARDCRNGCRTRCVPSCPSRNRRPKNRCRRARSQPALSQPNDVQDGRQCKPTAQRRTWLLRRHPQPAAVRTADEGHRPGLGRAGAIAGSIGGVEEARDHAGLGNRGVGCRSQVGAGDLGWRGGNDGDSSASGTTDGRDAVAADQGR